jgi:hypothetical protein
MKLALTPITKIDNGIGLKVALEDKAVAIFGMDVDDNVVLHVEGQLR